MKFRIIKSRHKYNEEQNKQLKELQKNMVLDVMVEAGVINDVSFAERTEN